MPDYPPSGHGQNHMTHFYIFGPNAISLARMKLDISNLVYILNVKIATVFRKKLFIVRRQSSETLSVASEGRDRKEGGWRGGLLIRGAREWVGPRPTSQEDGWEERVERERKARGIPAKIHW